MYRLYKAIEDSRLCPPCGIQRCGNTDRQPVTTANAKCVPSYENMTSSTKPEVNSIYFTVVREKQSHDHGLQL